jgi:thiamine-phosphate pyrophosphorylase
MGTSAISGVVLVTPDDLPSTSLEHVVEEACRGGVSCVQLRRKRDDGGEVLRLAKRLREITRRHNARLLVNDRVDIAALAQADGVHLPERGMRVADARKILGPKALIGRSVHSIQSLLSQPGADWVQFGPVFPTPSKMEFGAQGLEELSRAAESAHREGLALCAVGGIDEHCAAQAIEAGADAIAVIRSIAADANPYAAARRLLSTTKGC